ncbi:MAG TPA: hypothetical protein VJU16_07975 [Planctomycetota bacterium]|nr:hypothetical protein [Planctomycetota bacterium]
MKPSVLWKSPRIPDDLVDDDDILWDIRAKVDELASDDSPSTSDTAMIFRRYNSGSPAERDAIDAAFVWMTGYTLASICAMVATPKGKDYEHTLEKWRKTGS